MNNGQQFTDLSKEAAIAGSIAIGDFFELIPFNKLIPPAAFADPAWKIIYGAAFAMRKEISATTICAESVSDYIAFHELDGPLQKAIDSTNTKSWREWHKFTDTSSAYGPSTHPLEYRLDELNHLYVKRQRAKIGADLAEDIIPWEQAQKAFAEIETFEHQPNGCQPGIPLMSFADTFPDPIKTLLGNRFLCREGGMLFVGPSGIGKTAASVQQDLFWSIGLPAFGIAPARPLKILTIQAEDDDGDLSEIVSGIKSHAAFSQEQIILSLQNCFCVPHKCLTGTAFLEKIVSPLLAQYQPDLLRINPLQAYLGGDIKDAQITGAFLRNGLNPLLVTHQCGLVLVHHTPKTNFVNTEKWKASDWMYAGAGSADITNWARAALIIDSTTDPHVFTFIAAKRGSRIGWANEEGDSIAIRHFSHSASSAIFWHETEETDIPEASRAKSPKKQNFVPEDILEIMPPSPLEISRAELTQLIQNRFHTGLNKTTSSITILIANQRIEVIKKPRANTKPIEFLRVIP